MAQLKDTVVSGNLRVTDTTLTDTLQTMIIRAPSTSGGTTYSAGTSGNVLKSNGTSTYWGTLTAADVGANYSAGNHLALSSTTFSLANYCKSITDWNSAKTNGWYMGSSVTNAPSTAWWFGRVVAHNDKYCMQEVWQFTASTSGLSVPHKMRMFVNNVWGNWVDITVGKAVPTNALFTDTWEPLTGATSSENGTVGYINTAPPSDGYNTKYFRADGTWAVPPGTYVHPTYTRNDTTSTDSPTHGSTFTAIDSVTSTNGHVTAVNVKTITLPAQYSHPTYTRSNTTSTASPAHGGTFTTIDSITTNSLGHVTAVNTKTVTLPTDQNTDTKVTQSAATTTTNYRPLVLGFQNSTDVSTLANTVTNQVYTTTKIYAQPSTGNVYASTFVGKLSRSTGGTWITARDNAAVLNGPTTTANHEFYPIGFAKTNDGGWAIGALADSNTFNLTYTTDEDYDSNTNNNTYLIEFPKASGTVALTNHTHDSLTTKTLTATTLENTAGNFFFGGSNLLGGNYDWVGIQADAGNDKFQLIAQAGGLIFRQNDSGGTDSTNWNNWVNLLTPDTISGTNGITATVTTSTIGSGTSALTYNSGVQIGHSNSITAVTTAGMLKVKYDAHGHITGSSAFASADVSTLLNLLTTGSSTPVDADYYIAQYAGGGTTTTTYHRRPVSALWTYMKGKADSVYAPLSHNHAAGDITSGALPIAHGGTGATTRLNALKALTDENVGTSAQYFLTITNSWGKGGYTSVENAKTVLGLGSAAYTASTDYATSGHTHSNYLGAVNANGYYGMAKPDGTTTDWIRTTNKGLIPYEAGGAGSGHQSLGTSTWYFADAYIDTVHGSLSGNASTATTLETARSIALGSDFQGSATFDGSADITISGSHYHSNVDGGNKANYPWHRIATTSGRSGSNVDVDSLLLIRAKYNGGSFGILKISLRTNGSGTACDISARWIVRYGFSLENVVIAEWGNTGDAVYADVFLKCGVYPRVEVVQLLGSRAWTLVASNEVNNTTTSDKLTSTEVYASVALAATEIHGKAYTKTANSISAGRVAGADNADNVYSTLSDPTAEETSFIPSHLGASNAYKSLRHNDGLMHVTKNGTASVNGYSILAAGNLTASGTAGNKYGIVRIYSRQSYYANIETAATYGANRTFTLPNTTGTIALTSDIPGAGSWAAVGYSNMTDASKLSAGTLRYRNFRDGLVEICGYIKPASQNATYVLGTVAGIKPSQVSRYGSIYNGTNKSLVTGAIIYIDLNGKITIQCTSSSVLSTSSEYYFTFTYLLG